jgi:hypothetical protein
MMTKLYGAYGLLLTALSGYLGYTGFMFSRGEEVKNVPRSVRDNPGSYRSIYSNYSRYRGGK